MPSTAGGHKAKASTDNAAGGAAAQRARAGGDAPAKCSQNPTARSLVAASDAEARAVAKAPASLLGRTVRRKFKTGWFTGTVTRTERLTDGPRVWRVVYTDGDEEECEWDELRDILLPRDAEKARTALSVAAAPAVAPPGGAPATEHNFKGITRSGKGFYAQLGCTGMCTVRGVVRATAAAAANDYDELARAHGIKVVNTPRAADEVQAVRGEAHRSTMCRARESSPQRRSITAAQRKPAEARLEARGGSGAAAVTTKSVKAPTSSHKRKRSPDGGSRGARGAPVKDDSAVGAAPAAPAAASAATAATTLAAAPAARVRVQDEVATMRAFFRGVSPPLARLDAVLAAVPGSGVTMEHLAKPARMQSLLRHDLVASLARSLHVDSGDMIAFMAALDTLHEA